MFQGMDRFSHETRIKLKAFPEFTSKDIVVQAYVWCEDKQVYAQCTAIDSLHHLVRFYLDKDVPWQTGFLEHRIFMRRQLYTHMDRHVESKSVERKAGTLPFRPVLSLVAVAESYPMVVFAGGSFNPTREIKLYDAQRKNVVGEMTIRIVARDGLKSIDYKDGGISWPRINKMALEETDKAARQQAEKIHETNITELPRRAWSRVWTPTGEVPLWMWVWAGIHCAEETHGEAFYQLNQTFEQVGRLAQLLVRVENIDDGAFREEFRATRSCLAARHMAYLKDMIKSSETARDRVSDFWTYPWHSPDASLQEIDCEDGAILTLAIETTFKRLGEYNYGEPAFAILTLRPPTDGAGKQWTYHAVCMRFHTKWLDAKLSGQSIQEVPYAAMMLDTSASHECLWVDKPGAAEYAALDSKAIPPEASGFAMHRNTWRDVKEAKIYGHVQTIVLKYKGEVRQLELTWKGKLGVPIDVLMDAKQACSDDLNLVPLDLTQLEERTVIWGSGRTGILNHVWLSNFEPQQPDLPLFQLPKEEFYLGQTLLRQEVPEQFLKYALLESGPDPQARAATVVEASPLAREGDALFTIRRADFSPELLALVQKHNAGKQVFHHDITLMGDIACTLFIVRSE